MRAYNPLVWRRPIWVLNHRDHRKILIVDGQVSFTGGLEWRDTQVRINGPEVAAEMLELFHYGWRRATPYTRR